MCDELADEGGAHAVERGRVGEGRGGGGGCHALERAGVAGGAGRVGGKREEEEGGVLEKELRECVQLLKVEEGFKCQVCYELSMAA
jgi:hypothetical protein